MWCNLVKYELKDTQHYIVTGLAQLVQSTGLLSHWSRVRIPHSVFIFFAVTKKYYNFINNKSYAYRNVSNSSKVSTTHDPKLLN